jgi:hypothetical protein
MGLLDRIGAFERYKVSPTQGTSGLLTGAGQPMSPFAQQAARNIGGALGMDMRTGEEKLTQALAQVDPNSPDAEAQQLAALVKFGTPAQKVQATQRLTALRKEKKKEREEATEKEDTTDLVVNMVAKKYGEREDVDELIQLASQGANLTDIETLVKKAKKGDSKVLSPGSVLVDDEGNIKFQAPFKPQEKPAPKEFKIDTEDAQGNPVTQIVVRGDNDQIRVLKEFPRTGAPATGNAVVKLQGELLEGIREEESRKNRANKLVLDLNKMPDTLTSGQLGVAEAYIKGFSGRQDAETLLRTEATALRNSNAIKNLPKGPASDKDVALVLAGELDPYSNKETLLAYARGIAKIAAHAEQNLRDQSAWIGRYNGSLDGFSDWQQVQRYEREFASLEDPSFLAEAGIPSQALQIIRDNPNDLKLRQQFVDSKWNTAKYDYGQALENYSKAQARLASTGRTL